MIKTKVNWYGQSGHAYEYEVFDLNTEWNEVPCNYIFAKPTSSGWVACYIGQTGNMKDRHSRHHKRECAIRHGATHIHAHVNSLESNRLTEETDLVRRNNPPCND